MKKLVLFSTLAFAVVLLSGCMNKDQDVDQPTTPDTVMTGTTTGEAATTGTLVGKDKDEHGCIASAGYTRNERKQECTRSREDNQAT